MVQTVNKQIYFCFRILLVLCLLQMYTEETKTLQVRLKYDVTKMHAGIYILKKIRNYTKTKVQNGETLPKLNIGIYSKFDQYYRYNIIMYDFIHIIQFLIPIWNWISKMMQENATF